MYLLVELFLIFVPVMAFCLWQIRAVRRSRNRGRDERDG